MFYVKISDKTTELLNSLLIYGQIKKFYPSILAERYICLHLCPHIYIKMNSFKFNIGNIIIGEKKIILQSMTSTSTKDIKATTQQCVRMADAGAEMIRITARDVSEAENLKVIKEELAKLGYDIPIIADVHFNPRVAETAAGLIDKVRVNPGNYVDKKKGKTDWTEEDFKAEHERIKERLSKLVQICIDSGTAIRVGVNHGSLSERMIHKFGDTAEGMVESALEFIRIFNELDFHRLVISLKASNVVVMVQANQLMAQRMKEENINYPLHLGVTEAGDAEDGRIKSATGIGLLLSQGIGSTIRVSLTEEPEFEIPVARKIVEVSSGNCLTKKIDFFNFNSKKRNKILNIGGGQLPVVIDSHESEKADYVSQNNLLVSQDGTHITPFSQIANDLEEVYFYETDLSEKKESLFDLLSSQKKIVIVVQKTSLISLDRVHEFMDDLEEMKIHHPIILKISSEEPDYEKWMLEASIIASSFLLSSKIDGLWLFHPVYSSSDIAFGILQATRKRISKTEYIACPSCGRTLFNIQEKLQEVKAKTSAFKGLKIAVMGCIVNGLGEMADADYGYVGAGKGKVNLYKGHELLIKNVDESEAADQLLEIINNSNKL